MFNMPKIEDIDEKEELDSKQLSKLMKTDSIEDETYSQDQTENLNNESNTELQSAESFCSS